MSYPLYFETGAIGELTQEYPLGDALPARFRGMSSDELRALQNSRFLRLMERAWQVPFYQRLWGAAGVEAGISAASTISKNCRSTPNPI